MTDSVHPTYHYGDFTGYEACYVDFTEEQFFKKAQSGKVVGVWDKEFHLYFQELADNEFIKSLMPGAVFNSESQVYFFKASDVPHPMEALNWFMEALIDDFYIDHQLYEHSPLALDLNQIFKTRNFEKFQSLDIKMDELNSAMELNFVFKIYLQNDQLEKTFEVIQKLMNRYPNFAEGYNNFGFLLWLLKRKREALAMFTESLYRNPFSKATQHNFMECGLSISEIDPMLNAVSQIYEVHPICIDLKYYLASLLLMKNQKQEAKLHLEEILKNDPHHQQASELLATIQEK